MRFSLASFWGWCGGRHFCLAIFFAIAGTWLAAHNLLTNQYVALITGIQTLVAYRTTHDDKREVALAKINAESSTDSNAPQNPPSAAQTGVGSVGAKG